VIGSPQRTLVVAIEDTDRKRDRIKRDGSYARNDGTEPFRYVAEECVAIVGAAIVSLDPRSSWARKSARIRKVPVNMSKVHGTDH